MGREPSWTEKNWEDWDQLRTTPEFSALAGIATKGLSKLEPSDVKNLLEASPVLTPSNNVTAIRRDFKDAISRVEPETRRLALEALMRASEISERMTVDGAQKLARVFLGEANGGLAGRARQLGKEESELTPLEKTGALTGDNEAFRRAPKKGHRPGERMLLLRDLYDQLFPAEGAPVPAAEVIADQPLDTVTYKSAQSDLKHVRTILERQYETTLELTRFASIIIDDHRAIEHLSMNVELRDCDEDYFWFDVKRDFSARIDRYFIGIAAGEHSHRTVMRHVPELRELIWLPPDTDLETEVDKLVRDGMLMMRDPKAASGYRAAEFVEIPEDDPVAERLRGDGLDRRDYRLLEAEEVIPDELLQYRSALCMRLRRERRRCTWFADGPTYIDDVSISIAGFADAADSNNLAVAYFMPGTDLSHGPDRFEREVQSWVVRHHGFTISW